MKVLCDTVVMTVCKSVVRIALFRSYSYYEVFLAYIFPTQVGIALYFCMVYSRNIYRRGAPGRWSHHGAPRLVRGPRWRPCWRQKKIAFWVFLSSKSSAKSCQRDNENKFQSMAITYDIFVLGIGKQFSLIILVAPENGAGKVYNLLCMHLQCCVVLHA